MPSGVAFLLAAAEYHHHAMERSQSVDIYFFYCESLHKVHSKNSLQFFAIPASHAPLATALVDGGGAAAAAGGRESCATLIFHPASWPHTLCPQLAARLYLGRTKRFGAKTRTFRPGPSARAPGWLKLSKQNGRSRDGGGWEEDGPFCWR